MSKKCLDHLPFGFTYLGLFSIIEQDNKAINILN